MEFCSELHTSNYNNKNNNEEQNLENNFKNLLFQSCVFRSFERPTKMLSCQGLDLVWFHLKEQKKIENSLNVITSHTNITSLWENQTEQRKPNTNEITSHRMKRKEKKKEQQGNIVVFPEFEFEMPKWMWICRKTHSWILTILYFVHKLSRFSYQSWVELRHM